MPHNNKCQSVHAFCVCSQGAVVKDASTELVEDLDTNKDGTVSLGELVEADASTLRNQRKSSDHRDMAEVAPSPARRTATDLRVLELVAQLKAAVDSIPSYIERSSMMWVVVPPVKHHSLEGQICDFSSWRKRGWCRMEFAACKVLLATADARAACYDPRSACTRPRRCIADTQSVPQRAICTACMRR